MSGLVSSIGPTLKGLCITAASLLLLQQLQLFVQQAGFFQFSRKIPAAELKPPVETDGKGAEGDNQQCLKEVAPGEHIAWHHSAHGEMTVETNQQRDHRGVDELEQQVAANDVIYPVLVGSGAFEDVLQDIFGHGTGKDTHKPHSQQMNPCHPLPCFQTEWLENRKRQYRKNGADCTGRDRIFLS